MFLSVMTIGELEKGIRRREMRDPPSAVTLREWLEAMRVEESERILPITEAVALAWGRIAAGRTRNIADALIAATAIVHNLTLVTRNTRDFEDLSLPLVNPWLG